ncbi:MAG: GMC family oxidoreductase [Deltaproteobacteria bacterium]|nr:GMC family oxidoreductase [Deltaproteobacteria bacterium]
MTSVVQGRDAGGDLELSAEVAVVGSGASGAVIAKELAEAGLDVVILEEGGYVPPEVYGNWRPTQTLRHMARLAGAQVALGIGDSPVINILTGRTVGGSSTMTGGVCFRIPEGVLERWQREQGLTGYLARDLEYAYQSVEREIHVEEVPVQMRSRGSALFAEGAARRGLAIKPVRRNTQGCRGSGRCTFGCPVKAKLSVDLTYLRKAQARGARVYSDCLVERVVEKDGRAAGLSGRVLNGPHGGRGGKLRVSARTVVVCAGALHTPKILARSKVGRRSRQLGRHVTLHPGFRVAAEFEERVEGWKGALQSIYSDALAERGITFVGIWVPTNVTASALPGIGRELDARVRRIPHLALFGGMVHDEGGGRIFSVPGREPLLVYKMHPRDKARMLEGMRVLGECFFEAGAHSVILPILGSQPITSPDGLKAIDERIPARRFECAAFHPLGSARMGCDPRTAVVAPNGETYDLPGLYVADGSLFPTSIGVNSQLPIMAVATKIAWGMRERLG